MAEKKRALVLAGGGARGAFQVGMLEELVINQGLDFGIIRGVSVGALNAAFLAQAPAKDSIDALKGQVAALRGLWESGIKGNESVYEDRGGFVAMAAGADSIYSLDPLRKLIEQNVSLQRLRSSGRNFAVGTVSLKNGRYAEWGPEARNFTERLIASASIPVVFPFVDLKTEKDVLVDGGVRNITPLSSAFSAGPDEVYVLLTSRLVRTGEELPESGVQEHKYGRWRDSALGTRVNGIDVLKRTVDILTDEIYLDDIRGALHWNDIAGAIDNMAATAEGQKLPANLHAAVRRLVKTLAAVKKRHVPVYVIAPRQWYWKENGEDRNSSTEFSPNLIRRAIRHGREVAANPDLWLWPPA